MNKIFVVALLLFANMVHAQNKSLEPFPLDDAWKQKIYGLAPDQAVAPISGKHKVLLFSLYTGFKHWAIPHADAVITILSEKTGAYQVVQSVDISMFEEKNLKQFDAIVLNNNCSIGPRRDLFYDAINAADSTKSEVFKTKKAAELEANLLDYVKRGGGLAVIHGGIVMQNNSEAVSEMVGGSFNYHPKQQEIELKPADENHPMTQAFDGKSFTHFDEPYFFKNAYDKKHFKPLLYMENAKIEGIRHETEDKVSYVSWIKKYGKGRVFYSSPSHNAQSYENSSLLRYYLNGMQYALGDLKCDDSPMNP